MSILTLSKKLVIISLFLPVKLLGRVEDKLDVQDINIDIQKEEEKSFSKKNIHITSKEEQDRLDYGKKVHELFELTDFHNTSKTIIF